MKGLREIITEDIAEYLKSMKEPLQTGNDFWFVMPSHLFTKETVRLNRQLGIDKINHIGKTNNPSGKRNKQKL